MTTLDLPFFNYSDMFCESLYDAVLYNLYIILFNLWLNCNDGVLSSMLNNKYFKKFNGIKNNTQMYLERL